MSKKMKKLWSLMLVALVTMGAAACSENDENVDTKQETAALSFYAEIADNTRATIDRDGDRWKTSFEKGDILNIGGYEFTYNGEKFVCYDEGAWKNLVGTTQIIEEYRNVVGDSTTGKNAYKFKEQTVENFQPGMTIKLEPANSFFTFNYTGEITLTANENIFYVFNSSNGSGFKYDVCSKLTLTAEGETFVAIYPTGNNTTISYSIDGIKCKETTKTFQTGRVYNLGTFTEKVVLLNVNEWSSSDAKFAAYFFNNTTSTNKGVMLDKISDNTYGCIVPNGTFPNVIFCRMNSTATSFDWSNVWNQTVDLTLKESPYNNFIIHGYKEDWGYGAWSTTENTEYSGFGLVGSFQSPNTWDPAGAIAMVKDSNWAVAKNIEFTANTEFKVVKYNTWDKSFGPKSATTVTSGTEYSVAEDGQNFKVATAGTYDVYFNNSSNKLKVVKK